MVEYSLETMRPILEALFSNVTTSEMLSVAERVFDTSLSFSEWDADALINNPGHGSYSSKSVLSQEVLDQRAQYVSMRLSNLKNEEVAITEGGPGIPNGNYLCWVNRGNTRYGLLTIKRPSDPQREVSPDLIVFFSHCLSQICAEQTLKRPMSPNELLDDLLAGRITSYAQLRSLPNVEAIQKQASMRTLVALPMSEEKLMQLSAFMSMHFHQSYPKCWCAWNERMFVALMDEKMEQKHLDRLKKEGITFACPVCIGPKMTDLLKLPAYCRDILALPQLRKAEPGEVFYLNLYPESILINHSTFSKDELQSLCHPVLDEIEQYDRANGTVYMDTIRSYIDHRFNATHTAQALYIHTNTIFYRMNRIEELFHLDVMNPDVLFSIMFALRIKEHLI